MNRPRTFFGFPAYFWVVLTTVLILGGKILYTDRNTTTDVFELSSGSSSPADKHAVLEKAAAELHSCQTLACVRKVHSMSQKYAKFNFPHFIIAGYPKAATTSLHSYLLRLPQIQAPTVKEPHFFRPMICHKYPGACPIDTWKENVYIQDVLGASNATGADFFSRATYEASASYAQGEEEHVQEVIRREVPWVKIVVCLREPISRAISEENMKTVYPMLAHDACFKKGSSIYPCLKGLFQTGGTSYSYVSLDFWLKEFPKEQLHVIQFEKLTGNGSINALEDLHRFLGLDPPRADIRLTDENKLKDQGLLAQVNMPGWPIQRNEYESLVNQVREDARRLVRVMYKHGLGNAMSMLDTWEEVWKENLSRCDKDGQCYITVT